MNVGRALYELECSKGLNTEVHHPEAVIRSQRAAQTRPWVAELMVRGDADDLRLLPPDHPQLIAWVLSRGLKQENYAVGGEACNEAHALGDRQRAAMGAAG